MKYKVIQSKNFNQSFDDVFNYIYKNLKSPKAADNFRKRVIESAKNLQTMPEAYPRLEGIKFKNKPVRFFNVKNFTVLFVVKKDTVIMHNLVYSKSNTKSNISNKNKD